MAAVDVHGVRYGEGPPALVVPCMGSSFDESLEQALEAQRVGAQIVEWRADFADCMGDVKEIARRCQAIHEALDSTPLIFTLRTCTQGGHAEVQPSEYFDMLATILAYSACDILDVEECFGEEIIKQLVSIAHDMGVLVLASYHNFESTPSVAALRQKFYGMHQAGADICKIAVQAQCHSDALRLMSATAEFANSDDRPAAVGIAMGAAGAITRKIGESFGSVLAFAQQGQESAPGQLSVTETRESIDAIHAILAEHRLLDLSVLDRVEPGTHAVVLLGSPVRHSLSPAIHSLSFAEANLAACYMALDCSPESVGDALQAMKHSTSIVGANVTMPLKQKVIKHLDGIDNTAAIMGSVNTIVIRDGNMLGYNTDGLGLARSLAQHGIEIKGSRVCVLGAGGAASALVAQCAFDCAALINVMCRIDSAHRTSMTSLISELHRHSTSQIVLNDIQNSETLNNIVQTADILINATPVGMGDTCAQTLVDASLLRPELIVVELVYHPRETRLLREARAAGCQTIDGIEILLNQAVASEEIWFENLNIDVGQIVHELF